MRNQFRSGLMSPPPKVGGYGYEIGSGMNRTMRNQYGRNQGQAPMPNAMPNPASAMEAMPNPNYAPPAPAPMGQPGQMPQQGGYGFAQGSGLNRMMRNQYGRNQGQPGQIQDGLGRTGQQQGRVPRWNTSNFRGDQGGY